MFVLLAVSFQSRHIGDMCRRPPVVASTATYSDTRLFLGDRDRIADEALLDRVMHLR